MLVATGGRKCRKKRSKMPVTNNIGPSRNLGWVRHARHTSWYELFFKKNCHREKKKKGFTKGKGEGSWYQLGHGKAQEGETVTKGGASRSFPKGTLLTWGRVKRKCENHCAWFPSGLEVDVRYDWWTDQTRQKVIQVQRWESCRGEATGGQDSLREGVITPPLELVNPLKKEKKIYQIVSNWGRSQKLSSITQAGNLFGAQICTLSLSKGGGVDVMTSHDWESPVVGFFAVFLSGVKNHEWWHELGKFLGIKVIIEKPQITERGVLPSATRPCLRGVVQVRLTQGKGQSPYRGENGSWIGRGKNCWESFWKRDASVPSTSASQTWGRGGILSLMASGGGKNKTPIRHHRPAAFGSTKHWGRIQSEENWTTRIDSSFIFACKFM